MATSARRQRRKQRNRDQIKARSRTARNNRIKQFTIIAIIAVAIISGVAFAASTIGPLDPGTITTHGG